MEIFALVGESGTGKSHRALLVADKYQIPLILDDGLLIRKGRILAGLSAKKEVSKLKAVKRAIFFEEEHAKGVRDALASFPHERILILGTSQKMIHRIVKHLQLTSPITFMHISQVASSEEIAMARRERDFQGKHVIPVSTIEVKKNFPMNLLKPLQFFLRNRHGSSHFAEKTIVRPGFSWYGQLFISDAVMKQLVVYTALHFKEVAQIPRVTIKEEEDKRISISIDLDLYYGCHITEVAWNLQQEVKKVLEYNTGLDLDKVEANVLSLSLSPV